MAAPAQVWLQVPLIPVRLILEGEKGRAVGAVPRGGGPIVPVDPPTSLGWNSEDVPWVRDVRSPPGGRQEPGGLQKD